MASKLQRMRDFVRRNREQAQATVLQLRTDVETMGSSALTGYARGRFGDERMRVGNVDVELIVGGLGKAIGYSGMLGKAATPDIQAISNGVLGAYSAFWALEMGQRHRNEDAAAVTGVGARRMGVGMSGNVSPIGAARAAR